MGRVAVEPDTASVPFVTLIFVIGRPTVAPSIVSDEFPSKPDRIILISAALNQLMVELKPYGGCSSAG